MITVQPAPVGGVLSALAPVVYEVTATTLLANPPLVKAQLFINGAAYGASATQQHYSVALGAYAFRFDLSLALQQYLSNTDTFAVGANTNTAPAPDASNVGFAKKCEFYVVFTVWESSAPFGIYEATPTTYTSSTLYALNLAASQFVSEAQIEDYTAVLPLKFLTLAPKTQGVYANEALYLSFWDTGSSRRAMRIRRYDAAGLLLGTTYYDIGQPLDTVRRVRRLAVGAAHIGLIVSLAGVYSYDICVVLDDTAPVVQPITEVRTYVINAAPVCTHWVLRYLNTFGADDAVVFDTYEQRNTTQLEGYTANVQGYPTRSTRGRTTLNSRGTVSITLTRESIPRAKAYQYYELRNSAVLQLHKVGDFATPTAVVIDGDTEGTLDATQQGGMVTAEVALLYANTEYSHSN
jgi:hypothetical protein